VGWFSSLFGKRNDSRQRATELAERLNRQRIKWLDAVSVACHHSERILGAAPAGEADPSAASAMTSAFQAVHVLSLVRAHQYVPAGEMTRFTTALSAALTNDAVIEVWRRSVVYYTDLERKPLSDQLLVFSEDVATAATGWSPLGTLAAPALLILAHEFLYTNLRLAADFFGDELTARKMTEAAFDTRRSDGEHAPGNNRTTVPKWLAARAHDAPAFWRVVMDAADLRLQRDYPQANDSGVWGGFNEMAVVGGCVSLALQLHGDVPQPYRTPVERMMRSALIDGIPDAEAAYRNCVRTVREAIAEIPAAKRHASRHVLIAMWVLGALGADDRLANDDQLVAALAQVYQKESSGYWHDERRDREGKG